MPAPREDILEVPELWKDSILNKCIVNTVKKWKWKNVSQPSGCKWGGKHKQNWINFLSCEDFFISYQIFYSFSSGIQSPFEIQGWVAVCSHVKCYHIENLTPSIAKCQLIWNVWSILVMWSDSLIIGKRIGFPNGWFFSARAFYAWREGRCRQVHL